ncbi:pseudaminic acid synthase [Pampinifervens florentissimum]|uniref:pseudaminic acid synthase n=1 Tax=Pampinifervens florentissimum TaxID=1632019 RepID=UPI0013B47AB6|nr:pseudaminic acid synthase [Hydrogenobacter sp. T-8]QID32927.1 pseudaminic acid synthase [Hydrogenobacter sp. T-8]
MIEIGGKRIGEGEPVFVVAELSANHLQDLDLALKTIEAIKESGADAVKLQTYTPDTITLNVKNEHFMIKEGTLWDGQYLYDLYKKAYTPWEWHEKLFNFAKELGLVCFSSPFDKTAVDFLEELGTPAYKVASFEIVDIPLIEYIASKGKPVIISTGIATLSDIEEAIKACKRAGNEQIILLKCVSEYPTPYEDANLRTIPNMRETFGVPVGLSDHTLGIAVPIASVALGAVMVEKHFILDRNLGGPDSAFSLEPEEFKAMVSAIRQVEKALGKVSYELTERQKAMRKFSRSLFVAKDIKAGETFTEENVRSVRPAVGLHPKYLKDILGRRARFDIKAGTPLSWELVE